MFFICYRLLHTKMSKKIICLFDVDGTLTVPRQKIEPRVENFLQETAKREKFDLAVVGGSDLCKIQEQLGEGVINDFKYVFAENGLIAFKEGSQLPSEV